MRAAVHWLIKHSGGGVLKPSDSTTIGGTYDSFGGTGSQAS